MKLSVNYEHFFAVNYSSSKVLFSEQTH